MKLLALALLPAVSIAAPVLDNVRPTTCVPDYARRNTAVIGTLNRELFAAGQLELSVLDEGTVEVPKLRATENEWIGRTEKGATLTFTRVTDIVTGTLNKDGRTWELMPQCGGYVLYEIEPSLLEEPATPPSVGRPPDFDDPEARGTTNVDTLVLYTEAAALKWTVPVLESKVATAIANSNLWMEQSGATVKQTMVAFLPSPLQESGSGMATTQSNLRQSAQVNALRNSRYADVVTLISTDGGGYSGYATLYWYWNSTGMTSVEAHAIVNSSYLGDRTLAHETGHMLTLDHNRENAGGTNPGYHYGYRVCATDGTGFRDIMSYQCPSYGVSWVNYFSNPTLTYNGKPLGVLYSANPSTASETYRSLNENAPKIANFRNAPGSEPPPTPPAQPVPGMPQNLIATLSGGGVVLTWGYADNLAQSASIQRAKKNKGGKWGSYSGVGTVTAPTNTYKDVPTAGTYRYTVTAKNASGTSTAAGPVAITK